MFSRRLASLRWTFADHKQHAGKRGIYQGKPAESVIASQLNLRSYNIQISLDDYKISMYSLPLSLIKRQSNNFQVIRGSSVLGLAFIPKSQLEQEIAWQARKYIDCKFLDIGKFLYVEPGKGRRATICSSSLSKQNDTVSLVTSKEFTIRDEPANQTVGFTLKQQQDNHLQTKNSWSQIQSSLECTIPYNEYKVMCEVMKCSLFELSGWKIQMDLQKRDMMRQIFTTQEIRKRDMDLDNFKQN